MDGFDLKVLRLRANVSQWRAAQAVGIAPQDLCHAERGRRRLRPEAERRLIAFYLSQGESNDAVAQRRR
jgi:DNA-binding XRE family transcriptional regulator